MSRATLWFAVEGRRLLQAWWERTRLPQKEAALQIGIHPSHFNQFLAGTRRPGLDMAILIEERTGVPVRSWRRPPSQAESAKGVNHNQGYQPPRPASVRN